jgi:nicotinamide-nucleotide amidase
VIPRIAERSQGKAITSLVVRTTGIPESTLAERISAVEDGIEPLTLAYLPGIEGVDLRLTAWDMAPAAARPLLEGAAARIRSVIGDHAYGTDRDDLAQVLLRELEAAGLTVAVAESCTGGLVGERITEIPGSSAVFQGGVIAYANELKLDLLGVSAETLAEHGAVSAAAVMEMASGAARVAGADLAVAISGVAGPDGGSPEKPVGTVWFGFAVNGAVDAQRVVFPGDRSDIRGRAAQFALHGLLRRARSFVQSDRSASTGS